jgi:hypothetical protein
MFSGARELGAYQDEPPQLPSGSFGKNAMLRLGSASCRASSVPRSPCCIAVRR